MAIDHEDITYQLKDAPEFWYYTPCDDDKQPISPDTGTQLGLKRWQDRPYTLTQIAQMNGVVKAVAVLPAQSQTLVVDIDGHGADQTFEKHYPGRSLDDLPQTLTWTSGRPGRSGRAYLVPPSFRGQLRNKRKLKDKESPANGEVELLWNNCYAVVAGKHPNDRIGKEYVARGTGDSNGYYDWVPGCSPDECELAEVPEWLLQPLLKPDHSSAGRGFLSDKSRQVFQQQLQSNDDPNYDLVRAKDILLRHATDPDYDYDTWIMVGQVMHRIGYQTGKDAYCFQIWNEWSSRQESYSRPDSKTGECGENLCLAKWHSFDSSGDNARGFGSMLLWAQEEYGYQSPRREPESAGPKETTKTTEEEKVAELEQILQDLYAIEKKGDPNQRALRYHKRSQLYARRIQKDDVDREMLIMVANEYGLRIGENCSADESCFEERGLSTPITDQGQLIELIPGFLFAGKEALLNGASGLGKTVLLAGMSYCVATGTQFLDSPKGTPPELQGPTLWIGTDGGDGAHAMLVKYSKVLNPPDYSTWADNLTFWGADAKTKEKPWGVNVAGIHRLCTRLKQGHPSGKRYALVVIDTLKAVTREGKIDYCSPTMATVMALFQAIAAEYGATIVWAHHPTKSTAGQPQSIESSGGRADIYEVPDSVLQVLPAKRDGQKAVRMIVRKHRDGEGQDRSFDYVMDPHGGLFKVLEPESGTDVQLLDEIWSRNPAGISVKDLIALTGLSQSQVYAKFLTPFRKERWIQSKDGKFTLTKPGALKLLDSRPELAAEINAHFADGNAR